MHGIKPRTLNNGELMQMCADQIHEGGMPHDFQVELLRRFNYYMSISSQKDVLAIDAANPVDPRQLALPL